MLQGMAGSVVGIWVAHGEGRCLLPDEDVEARVLDNDLAPLRYADPHGRATQMYPHNPNGSPHGIAALCSGDGRHLAMMPHPERCVCWPGSVRRRALVCHVGSGLRNANTTHVPEQVSTFRDRLRAWRASAIAMRLPPGTMTPAMHGLATYANVRCLRAGATWAGSSPGSLATCR